MLVKQIMGDIGMEVGLDECAKDTFLRQKYMEIDRSTIIKEIDTRKNNKYLAIYKVNVIRHSQMSENNPKRMLSQRPSLFKKLA